MYSNLTLTRLKSALKGRLLCSLATPLFGLANPSLALASCPASHQETAPQFTNDNLEQSTTDAQPGRMWLSERGRLVWYSSHAIVFIAVVFHFQSSFYLESYRFLSFPNPSLIPNVFRECPRALQPNRLEGHVY